MASNGKCLTSNADFEPNVSTECLNAVRVLHQTIVSLRLALEKSQSELHILKSKAGNKEPKLKYKSAIENLTLENHVLRRRILSKKNYSLMEDIKTSFLSNKNDNTSEKESDKNQEKLNDVSQENEDTTGRHVVHELGRCNLHKSKTDSEESEEVDDIELIFTTDDIKTIGPQEELESISDENGEIYESKSEVNDQDEKILQPVIVTQSVLVETDISKCGIIGDSDTDGDVFFNPVKHYLTPNVESQFYYKEQLAQKKSLKIPASCRKPFILRTQTQTQTLITKPVSDNEGVTSVRDSEAQTDISAVPYHWKSESFLTGSKVNQNFPTLPSKFSIPVKQTGRKGPLKLTDKTQEARRILLSDINFTSMVPELSRSVDHLCQNGLRLPNTTTHATPASFVSAASKYPKSPALLSSGSSYSSKFEFNVNNSNWSCYDNAYIVDQDRSAQDLLSRRRHTWRPSIFSLDAYCTHRTSSVPPSPTLRRHSAAISSYSPAGNTDTQFYYPLPETFTMKTSSNVTLKNGSTTSIDRKPKTRVSFRGENEWLIMSNFFLIIVLTLLLYCTYFRKLFLEKQWFSTVLAKYVCRYREWRRRIYRIVD